MSETFTEKLHPGYAQMMELAGKPVAAEKSQFQDIRIFDTARNGRVLVLDDIVQLSTRDECGYSEMLAHVPIFEHGRVRKVMIVGGGDGAIAEEVLKHKDVVQVDLVDIDGRVIELSKQHLADAHKNCFADKRLSVHAEDAFAFLGRPAAKEAYDVIIADRPDPVGPAQVLFGDGFYDRIKAALTPGGFAVFQTGVPFFQTEELEQTLRQLRATFTDAGVFLTVVPSYIGGFMAVTWCGKGARLNQLSRLEIAQANFLRSGIATDYYNAEMHRAAFALPQWLKRAVG